MAVRHKRSRQRPKGQPFRRRLRSGKVITVKGRKVKSRKTVSTKKGPQLRAGLKFNQAGKVVKDRNAKRSQNRRLKQGSPLAGTQASLKKRRRRKRR